MDETKVTAEDLILSKIRKPFEQNETTKFNTLKQGGMRKLLRWIGAKLGIKTWYHVAATYPLCEGGFGTLSCTCGMRPWLHHDNYQSLVDYVQTQTDRKGVRPNLVSITRLGP